MQGRYAALPAPKKAPSNGRAGGYIPSHIHNIHVDHTKAMRGQWQEGGHNYGVRKFESKDIEEYRRLLVTAYECADGDITYKFSRIIDPDDEDRNTCLDLSYTLCYTDPQDGQKKTRIIYTTKVPVPEHIRSAAKNHQR